VLCSQLDTSEVLKLSLKRDWCEAGRRMRRACAGTPVHYEQTVRLCWKRDWCEAGEDDVASVYGYTRTPVHPYTLTV